ncbi:MAG TPA: geranylgeranylglyceryl/heptaprenylglyceryl phosphate synthase [Ferruginibacter sp.]|nr:geranylgeranylglyceryl/heptaprenylglyceryl phosphate synthase [Ferruginibacter sp.]
MPSSTPNKIYEAMRHHKSAGKKGFALLVDPDKTNEQSLGELIRLASDAKVDYVLVGGSLLISDQLDTCVRQIKQGLDIPVILFPGSPAQITPSADGLLYLSLISGRNPELLIGQHVLSAPMVKQSGLEILPTGYMVIDGGAPTTVSYISNAAPIPSDKADIAVCTAMAGEMLGLKMIYMDAGSGAKKPVSAEMIQKVSQHIDVPLWVGGGITHPEQAYLHVKNGADVVVVGNAIEKDPTLIREMCAAVHSVPMKA